MSKLNILAKRREMFDMLSDEQTGAIVKHLVSFAVDGEITNVTEELALPCYLLRSEMEEMEDDDDEVDDGADDNEKPTVLRFAPRREVSFNDAKSERERKEWAEVKEVFEYYREKTDGLLAKATLTAIRASNIKARIAEHGVDKCKEMVDVLIRSPFPLGKSESGWKANIDWVFRPTNFLKVLEGNYLCEDKQPESIINVNNETYEEAAWQ